MGLIDNKISCVGQSVEEVAKESLKDMVSDDSELITIFYGQETSKESAEALRDELQALYEDCDVTLYEGDQPLYYYIISVE